MEVSFVGNSDKSYSEFPVHEHGYWEVMYNKLGSGIMTVGDKEYPFRPGDIVIIPPGLPHGKKANDKFMDFCLFFKTFWPIGNQSFRIMHDDEKRSVAKLMDIAANYKNMDNVYEHAVLNALGDLLYQTLVFIYITEQPMDHRLHQIIEDMRNNISNPDYSPADSIAASGYCTGYFRRLFKASTNQSPVEYMQTLRINYAKSIINQYGNSRSIQDIAFSSGFRDPLYFSRVFKKVTGISPKEYEKQQLQLDISQIEMQK